jgi:hypothetical protein
MKFKTWIQNEISSTHTDMDAAPDQEKLAMAIRAGGKGGGAFPDFSLKDNPPKSKKSPTSDYEEDNVPVTKKHPLANYTPNRTFRRS